MNTASKPQTASRTVTVTLDGSYTADEIPPRCRKPRPVTHDATASVDIPIVTVEQAPVVIEFRDDLDGQDDDSQVRVLRGWDGRLFESYRPFSRQNDPTIVGDPRFPLHLDERSTWSRGYGSSQSQFEQIVADRFADYLIIETASGDLEVWAETVEPMYIVQTFGLGNNHGGTDVCVSWNGSNRNIQPTCHFSALDFEAARTFALGVAQRRGDTDSVARLEVAAAPLRVKDPSFLRLVFPTRESEEVRSARAQLRAAVQRYAATWDGDVADLPPNAEAEAFAALLEARDRMMGLTVDIVGAGEATWPYDPTHAG